MKFSKISVTRKGVVLTRETKDANGAVESVELDSPERPLASFSDALEAFVPYVVSLIPFLDAVEDELTVTTLNLSEDKNRLRGLIVTALWPVAKAYDKPLVLNTPLVRESGENASDEAFVLSDDVLQLIALAEAEATRYVRGERVQGELFTRAEATAPEPPSEKASENGTAAANGARPSRGKRRKKGRAHIPGVGDVVNPDATEPVTDDVLRNLLLLVSRDVPIDAIRQWTSSERRLAEQWAGAVHLSASDNDDVEVPAEPQCVKDAASPTIEDGWSDPEPPRVTSDDVQSLKAAPERANG